MINMLPSVRNGAEFKNKLRESWFSFNLQRK
jgi:hypothetical protein